MPETQPRTLTARTEAHSDAAETASAQRHLAEVTEAQFGRLLVKELRTHPAGFCLSDFQEEWRRTTDGAVYEITASISEAAESA